MPRYETAGFDPPAPIAEVRLRRADDDGGRIVSGVSLLIDTGADVTLLPRSAVLQLGLRPADGAKVELEGFDGSPSVDTVELDMISLNKAFRGRYLLVDAERGILGRDVLAAVVLLFDGPNQAWSEHAVSPQSA